MAPLFDPPPPELPRTIDTESEGWEDKIDDGTVSDLHGVMFDLHVVEGNLICPDTERKFAIVDGIPNMILHEDEI